METDHLRASEKGRVETRPFVCHPNLRPINQ
jgi:hypothetical protein